MPTSTLSFSFLTQATTFILQRLRSTTHTHIGSSLSGKGDILFSSKPTINTFLHHLHLRQSSISLELVSIDPSFLQSQTQTVLHLFCQSLKMKFSLAMIATAVAFLPVIEAHLSMINPGVYRQGDPLPPLAVDGSNFPCAVTDFSTSEGEGPTLNPGQGADIKLAGTVVHSGGSCQISITYDQPPTKNSVWKVMKSFQGACPVEANGNLPIPPSGPLSNILPPLAYTVPAGLPAGKATIAW